LKIYSSIVFTFAFVAFSGVEGFAQTPCPDTLPTIYVDTDGIIIGGPDNGKPYEGVLTGTDGADVIHGTPASDTIRGFQGADVICGFGADDILYGGRGADRIFGGLGNDFLRGKRGKDELHGGEGNDFVRGGKGQDTIFGDAGDDELRGGRARDIVNGGSGNDFIFGGRGDDQLIGGEGSDSLSGRRGDDNLDGGPGIDMIRGNGGFDTCFGEEISTCEAGDPENQNPEPEPGFVAGPEEGLAYMFLGDKLEPIPEATRALSLPSDSTIFSSIIAAVIRRTSSIRDVNAVLTEHNARIAISEIGSQFVTLTIPPQNSREELLEEIDQIDQSGLFSAVIYQSNTFRQLSLESTGFTGEEPELRHWVNSGMAAAWNARNLAIVSSQANKVEVLVPDFFCPQTPSQLPSNFRIFEPSRENLFNCGSSGLDSTIRAGNHGLGGVGILSAVHDGTHPTGGSPDPLNLYESVTGIAFSPSQSFQRRNALIRSALPTSSENNRVFSSSIHRSVESLATPADRLKTLVEASELKTIYERRPGVLFVIAAGNFTVEGEPDFSPLFNTRAEQGLDSLQKIVGSYPNLLTAFDGTEFEPDAGELSDLIDALSESSITASTFTPPNLMFVGARNNNGTLRSDSVRGSDVSAPGETNYTTCATERAGCNNGVMKFDQTSSATPVVSSLAAYLWNLVPDLLPGDLRQLISSTAKENLLSGSGGFQDARVDAFQAILSLDLLSTTSSPQVRCELLNVFTDDDLSSTNPCLNLNLFDLEAFLNRFGQEDSLGGSTGPGDRFDINGDGTVDGYFPSQDPEIQTPFDLNMDGQFGEVEVLVAGTDNIVENIGGDLIPSISPKRFLDPTVQNVDLTFIFDETNITDQDIVCYYSLTGLINREVGPEGRPFLYDALNDNNIGTANALDPCPAFPRAGGILPEDEGMSGGIGTFQMSQSTRLFDYRVDDPTGNDNINTLPSDSVSFHSFLGQGFATISPSPQGDGWSANITGFNDTLGLLNQDAVFTVDLRNESRVTREVILRSVFVPIEINPPVL